MIRRAVVRPYVVRYRASQLTVAAYLNLMRLILDYVLYGDVVVECVIVLDLFLCLLQCPPTTHLQVADHLYRVMIPSATQPRQLAPTIDRVLSLLFDLVLLIPGYPLIEPFLFWDRCASQLPVPILETPLLNVVKGTLLDLSLELFFLSDGLHVVQPLHVLSLRLHLNFEVIEVDFPLSRFLLLPFTGQVIVLEGEDVHGGRTKRLVALVGLGLRFASFQAVLLALFLLLQDWLHQMWR